MRHLEIKDFSCVKEASIEFGRLTILIGPQASGKSVICKLGYFFIDILNDQQKFIGKHASIDAFKDYLRTKFCEWFPPSAWGEGKFKIDFTAGEFKISFARGSYRSKVNDQIRIKISDEFVNHYSDMRDSASKIKEIHSKNVKSLLYQFESEWEIRDVINKGTKHLLGKDYVSSQTFVPAGRSFFTSIGKAIAAFDQGRILDPLIVKFGRVFAAYKERGEFYHAEDTEFSRSINKVLIDILGGSPNFSGDQELVECSDGRKIPLSALSSGQQEILPLVAVLPHIAHKNFRQCIYIEEPEAHLFPSAQSKLVALFAKIISGNSTGADLVLTTHSPYVLVKINNLIKAGQLGRSMVANRRNAVMEIIPRDSWIGSKAVKAYAIRDGRLHNIIDSDGLIDADYLDEVSGELSKEFLRLVQIEVSE